jgi:xylan 1,4-beta-xylosidase
VLYYNRHKFHFLAVTHDARLGRVLTVMNCLGDWPDGKLTFPLPASIPLADGPVALAADIDGAKLRFSYRNGREWLMVGPTLDASIVSDETGRGEHGSFTGAFVGMVAFDTSGSARPADFDYFSYLPA